MAERRMFTRKVTDDDNFAALSSSAQALYLHLSMCADDDGFCNQISICMFRAHASVQDLQALLEKRYIYQFDSGVIVIKHWRMANALRKDRYTPTAFQNELAQLQLKNNGSYTWLPSGCQMVAECLPQNRVEENRIVEDRLEEVRLGENRVDEGEEEGAPTPPAVDIRFDLADGSAWYPTPDQMAEWSKAFPQLVVDHCVRAAAAKNNAQEQKNRKNTTNICLYVVNWLNHEMGSGTAKKDSKTSRSGRGFADIPQHDDNDITWEELQGRNGNLI